MENNKNKIWGKHFLFVMKFAAENYPPKPTQMERDDAESFYRALRSLLPCYDCKKHYQNLLLEFPLRPAVQSREKLVNWVSIIYSRIENKKIPPG